MSRRLLTVTTDASGDGVASTPPLSGPVESVRYLHTDYADTALGAVTARGSTVLSVGSTAAEFDGNVGNYLVTAAPLSVGDVTRSWAGWVYVDNLANDRTLFAERTDVGARPGYGIYVENSPAGRLTLLQDIGLTTNSIALSADGEISAGAWYFISVTHNADRDEVTGRVNLGSVTDNACSGGLYSNNPFEIGSMRDGTSKNMSGAQCCSGIWSRLITDDEHVALYGGGSPLLYCALPSGLKSGLISYWDLQGGDYTDKHGSNDLTATGTVTERAGPAALTADKIYRPRTLSQASTAGETDLTFDGTYPVLTNTVLSSEPVTVTVSGGGNAKTGAWEIITGRGDHARRVGS
jgi:hypothetical protein